MTFLSVVETFGAVVVALGGLETFKWVKRTWFPSKSEKRQDESDANKSEVEVKQQLQQLQDSINETWQKNIKDFTDIDSARIKELRESNEILNNRITELLKAGARKDDIISDKTNKIRELEDSRIEITKRYEDSRIEIIREYEEKITQYTKRNGELEKLVMFYRAWHCEREYGNRKEDCKRRKPAQNPPLRYCPIEERVVSATEIPTLEPEDAKEIKLHPKEFEK